MGRQIGKGGKQIGDNSPNVGRGRKPSDEEIRRRVATRRFNRAKAELDEAAKPRGGTVGAGIGSMWGEVSEEAIINMARNQRRH